MRLNQYIFLLLLGITQLTYAQNDRSILNLDEYLSIVKKHHPFIKQANLLISKSEAKLLKSRGAFDPKIAADYNHKTFKKTEYYDILNASFKIPTWYGIEFKASIDDNSGEFLNPERNTSDQKLYNIGVSIPLAKNLLINKRMASLKKAKLYTKQAKAENQIAINTILHNATLSYFKWLKFYNEKEVYASVLENAKTRLIGVIKSYEVGDKPAIDTVEAHINYNTRKLNYTNSKLNYLKSSLEMSNYLWINDIPVEIQDSIKPNTKIIDKIDTLFGINNLGITDFDITTLPKLQALNYKFNSLKIDQKLKKNNLLPKINFDYNFLNQDATPFRSYNTANYKMNITVAVPLFLRKARGDLKLANIKLKDITLKTKATEVEITNKLKALNQEINSYTEQNEISNAIVGDYLSLLKGEERKFEIGESSLFLINYREAKFIDNQLKLIKVQNKLLYAKAALTLLLNKYI